MNRYEAMECIKQKKSFRAHALSGKNINDIYTVLSYGYYPIAKYRNEKWYMNYKAYPSVATKRHYALTRQAIGENFFLEEMQNVQK